MRQLKPIFLGRPIRGRPRQMERSGTAATHDLPQKHRFFQAKQLCNCLLKSILLLTLLLSSLRAQDNPPNDQLLVIFGSNGYILYKVLDFANDHGYRYIKILSYEFNAFEHSITGLSKGEPIHGGRYFELKDDNSSIAFLCYEEPPNDIYIIDLEKYRSLLDDVQGWEP